LRVVARTRMLDASRAKTEVRMTIEDFVGGFRARVASTRRPGQEVVDEPGMVALVGTSSAALNGRVLVTDDRALEVLTTRWTELHARVTNVFAGATECNDLMTRTGCRQEPCTAMVSHDLDAIPELDLYDGLTLRPVARTAADADCVPLRDAADAALRSDLSAAPAADLDDFVDYLLGVPNARFLAAVDAQGVVRATAATATFGEFTGVFFVNTDPGWRGRGVGTAMTAAALRAAADAGARTACLDASALGLSIYLRLGFTPVSANTLFVRQP
jgi:GNAT superfamily N-acetyltransferase